MIISQAYKEALFKNNMGTDTINITFNYVAFYSISRAISDFDSLGTLTSEIDRIIISDSNMTYNNSLFKIDFTIASDKVICATTSITAKNSTSTILTLDDASFFEIGNVIDIETEEGFIETSIIAKTGDDITILNPINALISGICRKKVTHAIILCNATSSYDETDLIFAFFALKFFKDNSASQEKILTYELFGD